ncbi:hypothetical protein AGMMS49579_18620 [Spirochaetia bacterium]|nr:hypothetical protein AGMMS49579_18620 [Spirochaetia bacterium]
MNKFFKSMVKMLSRKTIGIIVFIVLLYFCLWVYTIKYVPNNFKETYNKSIVFDLDEDQYKIIWYTLTKNKNYRFKWYPFIFDIILRDNGNNLDMNAAETVISSLGYRDLNNAHPRYYSLMRYINYDNNWKKCISILLSDGYYGNGISNLEDAMEYYYSKDSKNINERELIAIILLLFGPKKYEIGSNYSEIKIEEVFNEYRK